MRRLPLLSGEEVVKKLEKAGFIFVRQVGSHLILRRESSPRLTLSVPNYRELSNLHHEFANLFIPPRV